jgi:hypothetical protein
MKFDEARFAANVNHRAKRLFADGYSIRDAREREEAVYVTNEEGTVYRVETLFETCSCPCYANHALCKHLLGWERLLAEQTAQEEAMCAEAEAEFEARQWADTIPHFA